MNTGRTLILTSEAANLIGVSANTIRYWERTGRLPALKTSHGVRLFTKGKKWRARQDSNLRPSA
jgi:excisionase family DNA binding protein